MIEYRIEVPAKISIVKNLWKKFLKNDPMWHFTLEGTYIEIRVSRAIFQMEKFLRNKKWKFDKFEYKDNILITRKYQKQFEYIFHGYSELSMLVPRKKEIDWEINQSEVKELLERCVHLACNIFGFSFGGEVRMVNQLSLERAYMAGKMNGGLETFYEYDKRKKMKKKVIKNKSKI